MRFTTSLRAASTALLAAQSTFAISLNIDDTESIKSAAKTVAGKMLSYYPGTQAGQEPGLLPQPYYWWEAGAMFGALVDYWRYTGDTSYVNLTTTALLAQVGSTDNYMPLEQAKSLGNDDQAFWGFAAMAAAEYNYPNPPANKPQWLALAQAVFNSQAPRWDNATCGGGLRWQIFTFNNGYNYKNTISNGAFFNIAARLHAYTGNSTYLLWAETSYDWTHAIGLVDDQYRFFDGSDTTINCSTVNHIQWSYNAAVHLHGAAVLYNVTQSDLWKQRTQSIWKAMDVFFTGTNNQVMYEVACEPSGNCNLDQQSFKAYLARWMAATMKAAPFLYADIKPYLRQSAVGAAQSCVGGTDGITCGTSWSVGGWDNTNGVGQQMSALEVIQSLLIDNVAPPVTNTTGGTSKGNYAAGTGGDKNPLAPAKPITTADRAGAGILTLLVIVGLLGGTWWMIA